MNDISISVSKVSKSYKLYDDPSARLKEALFRGRKKYHRTFTALDNISMEIGRGETVGVIGRNGSGKSTLLQIIASILTPTSGTVDVRGRVAALLELGSGFDPEFTGRENVYLNGAVLGISKKEIDARFEEIEAFAGIGRFIDHPVKLYSSGMYVRLAFATAINVNPDILLIDEALAVGDMYFQHRCMGKIRQIQESGKTIFFVTHDTGAIVKLCTKAVLLERGAMVCMGKPDDVVQEYYRIIWNGNAESDVGKTCHADGGTRLSKQDGKDAFSHLVVEEITEYDNRFGNGKAEIIGYALTDHTGAKMEFFQGGVKTAISIFVKCHEDVDMPIAGFMIKDLLGNELIKSNSDVSDKTLVPCKAGESICIRFLFEFPFLRSGSYSVSAGFGAGTIGTHVVYDWMDNLAVYSMENTDKSFGLIDIPIQTEQVIEGRYGK